MRNHPPRIFPFQKILNDRAKNFSLEILTKFGMAVPKFVTCFSKMKPLHLHRCKNNSLRLVL